jgi:hypothetical protein
MLELTQPTLTGTTRHATVGVGLRVFVGGDVAVEADDCAAWSGGACLARLDGHRGHGDGPVGVSVVVSTVGLALHLWRVIALGRAVWNIARVPTG